MKGHSKMKLSTFVFIFVLIVFGGLIIYYQYMHKQQMQESVQTPTTETEKLMAKDLEAGYPETPTEVMKLWGRINQCMYNSALEDEQFETLLGQLRQLFAKELLQKNPEKNHFDNLKSEISDFQDNKNKIVSYSADTGKSVVYKTIQEKETANARISYFINRSNGYVKQYQEYILIKEDGKWKILGFRKASDEKSISKKEALAQ